MFAGVRRVRLLSLHPDRSDELTDETGWLLAVEVLYLVSLFVLVPGMFAGVRRVRRSALAPGPQDCGLCRSPTN